MATDGSIAAVAGVTSMVLGWFGWGGFWANAKPLLHPDTPRASRHAASLKRVVFKITVVLFHGTRLPSVLCLLMKQRVKDVTNIAKRNKRAQAIHESIELINA
jgi:hypothetical protein